MFVEIKNSDGEIELVNPNFVTKIMANHKGVRINLSDGSYIWTKTNIDEVWSIMEDVGE